MISFKGRINRKTFLIQSLIVGLLQLSNVFIMSYVQKTLLATTDTGTAIMSLPISLLSLIVSISVMVFIISITIKRWHDLGQSGWWTLLNFIPLVNIGLWIYMICKKGDSGSNQYGAPQK